MQAKELESLIAKLNHAAFIIPFARYFLSSLRDTDRDMQKKNRYKTDTREKEGGNLYYPLMLSSEKSYVILSHLTCVQK